MSWNCWRLTKFRAKLQEPVIDFDPTSNQTSEQLPTYNAYSIDGDVTAPLVYVNYGDREDYEQLDRLGISAKGAIVIARYGSWVARYQTQSCGRTWRDWMHHLFRPQRRRLLPGHEYPAGGWRPRDGVQRGSVMDTDYPGRPITPGVGATADAKRLAIKDARPSPKFRCFRFLTPTHCRYLSR